jgi:hypothetical protein
MEVTLRNRSYDFLTSFGNGAGYTYTIRPKRVDAD